MAIADTSVRHFLSSHSGAPILRYTIGDLVALLDACLINGYGSVTLTSLTVTGGVATATVSGGHGFVMPGTNSGPVIRVAGATPSELNGDWRIASVPGSTTFTFVTDTGDTTASGTITAKIAPLDWTSPHTDTNKAMYKSGDAGSTGIVLRVNDTTTYSVDVKGYESATGIDAGVNQFSQQLYAMKGNSTSPNTWRLFGDSKLFIFVPTCGIYDHLLFFGDYDPSDIAPGHPLPGFMRGTSNSTYTTADSGSLGSAATWAALAQSHTGATGGITTGHYWYGHASTASYFGSGSCVYPSQAGNKLLYSKIDLWESSIIGPVGMVPGLFTALQKSLGNSTYKDTVFSGDGEEVGRDLYCLRLANSDDRSALVDITGPWR